MSAVGVTASKIVACGVIDYKVQTGDAANPVLMVLTFVHEKQKMGLVKSFTVEEANRLALALLRAGADMDNGDSGVVN